MPTRTPVELLLWHCAEGYELYDLNQDPWELNNIYRKTPPVRG